MRSRFESPAQLREELARPRAAGGRASALTCARCAALARLGPARPGPAGSRRARRRLSLAAPVPAADRRRDRGRGARGAGHGRARPLGDPPHRGARACSMRASRSGFVHAQDRLWQMEFQRRLGAGRLAEILGAAALPSDRFMRTLGLYRRAEASLAHLDAGRRAAWLEAYAAGVNAFLATPHRPAAARVPDPAPRRARAVVARRQPGLAAADGARSRDQLPRRAAARPPRPAAVDGADRRRLAGLPGERADHAGRAGARAAVRTQLAAALPPAPPGGIGSNAWVVAGSRDRERGAAARQRSASRPAGARRLVPRRTSRRPELELVGATLPGVPARRARPQRQPSPGASPTPAPTPRTCSSSGSIPRIRPAT